MGVGTGSLAPPWILKFVAEKACFLSFEWEKKICTRLACPGEVLR